jgi:hypothetical protein
LTLFFLLTAGDSTHYRLRSNGETTRVDEIDDYWNGRYLSSGEAAWRVMGFHVTMKRPAVTAVHIHLPGDSRHVQYKRNNGASPSQSLLVHYFARPTGTYTKDQVTRFFNDVTYTEYYTLFRLCKFKRRNADRENFYIENCDNQPMHIVLRSSDNTHLCRLHSAKPTDGERFYLRAILKCKPGRSFRELRTVNGIQYPTFQAAATEMGLFADEDEGEYSMNEAVETLQTPHQMRLLFVHLLMNDCVDTPAAMWNTFRRELSLDFINRYVY